MFTQNQIMRWIVICAAMFVASMIDVPVWAGAVAGSLIAGVLE